MRRSRAESTEHRSDALRAGTLVAVRCHPQRRGATTKRLTAFDEYLVHQTPEPLSVVQTHHEHWRESLFFVTHRPDDLGDMVILTMATFPASATVDSLQLGNVGGVKVLGCRERAHEGDPHTMGVGAARVEVVRPFEELRLWADPDQCELGMDLTFRARTQPYGLRRGSMRAGTARQGSASGRR